MKNEKTTIIAGKLKGKTIRLPINDITRPTKNIIRESFFNRLQNDIFEMEFVEVFAGSGSMGLEAISRGAISTYFLEDDNEAIFYLKKNIKNLDITNTQVLKGNSFEKITNIFLDLKRRKNVAWFYIDPPFNIRENHENIYEKVANLIQKIPTDVCAGITIEHISTYTFEDKIGNFSKEKTKKFGKTALTYFFINN